MKKEYNENFGKLTNKKLYKIDGGGGVLASIGLCNVMLLKFHLD
jgi:hypothetical protein